MSALDQESRTVEIESFVDIVAENIRALAALHGMSQKELAEEIGMTQAAASVRWRGKRQWQLEDIQKVAEIFGINPWEITQPHMNMGNARRLASVPNASQEAVGPTGLEPVTYRLKVWSSTN